MYFVKVSVIFSTYNSPEWLKKVVWGFSFQTFTSFEIIIADDGSTEDTKECINHLREETQLTIHHVWHEDNGFRKTEILNKALVKATGDYIVFTDGDCIPREDFLQTHVEHAEKGYFLSGGYFKLPLKTSQDISYDDIKEQRCFDYDWLKKHGLDKTHKASKLTAKGWKAKLYNRLTPTNATWNGHNASGWKTDLLRINGFDERMRYGGEDRELGDRLFNLGIKSKQIRYSAIVVHLDHPRGYVNQEDWDRNNAIRTETKATKRIRTEFGIEH